MREILTNQNIKKLSVTGENNNIDVHPDSTVGSILVVGHGNSIEIDRGCRLIGSIVMKCSNGCIKIGEKTTSMGLMLYMHEESTISIGEDCMFSGGIWMDVSDNHSIIDVDTGKRINPCRPIVIGNHVWVGRQVSIMKGTKIGNDAIIGAGSMVVGEIPANTLAVGSPARVLRNGVTWDRRRL